MRKPNQMTPNSTTNTSALTNAFVRDGFGGAMDSSGGKLDVGSIGIERKGTPPEIYTACARVREVTGVGVCGQTEPMVATSRGFFASRGS